MINFKLMVKDRSKNLNDDNSYNKDKEYLNGISQETKNGILAIINFSLAILTILSFAQKGGKAGEIFTNISQKLFGWGFFIIPVAFILLGISFLKSFSRKVYKSSFLGILFFVLGFLGILFIIGDVNFNVRISQGGYVGVILGYPLLSFLGFISSLVVLLTTLFISILVILDIPLYRLIPSKLKSGSKMEKIENLIIKRGQQEIPVPVFEAKKISRDEAVRRKKLDDEDENEFVIKTVSGREWNLPPLNILRTDSDIPKAGDIATNAAVIKRTLSNFGIDVEMSEVNIGPTVTQYTLRPAVGVKLSKITALNNDLALALASHPIRIEAPIPGKSLVGIEVPNKKPALVGLRNLLDSEEYQKSNYFFPLALGRDVAGYPVFAALEKMPHILIAGATGSGKSVCINSIILSLLYKHSPDILKFIFIDPKRVELTLYNGIPHLITPTITDHKKSINALRWLVKEMEKRYKVISESGAKDIFSFNARQAARKSNLMPFIILIIDELADLMVAYGREIEGSIVRLAQMARAVGIHLIVSTQRPSVEVITGLIKANITSRIAFQVASQVDSRTILDMAGAEKLLGNGDMLYLASDASRPRRIQGAFVSEKEIKAVTKFLKDQEYEISLEKLEPESKLEESLAEGLEIGDELESESETMGLEDPLYEQAKEIVIQAKKASASLLQRRLRIGYARAARLIDLLEERKIVGPAIGAKPREILVEKTDKPLKDLDVNRQDEENMDTLI